MTATRIPLILTRPEGSAARFVEAMPKALSAHFEIVISPLIDIAGLDVKLAIGTGDAVIFTSANGVRFAPQGRGRDAYCVGDVTSRAAALKGWQSHCIGETATALSAALIATPPKVKLWHLSGVHTRGDIAQTLSAAGMMVERVPLYDQRLLTLNNMAVSALTSRVPTIVPLFSPRTAVRFAQTCPENARPVVLALSNAVSEPLRDLKTAGLEIARVPTAPAMLESLEKLAARVRLG